MAKPTTEELRTLSLGILDHLQALKDKVSLKRLAVQQQSVGSSAAYAPMREHEAAVLELGAAVVYADLNALRDLIQEKPDVSSAP